MARNLDIARHVVAPSIITFVAIAVWTVLLIHFSFPDKQGSDFFPLRVGLEQIVHRRSPYAGTADYLRTHWDIAQHTYVAAVVAYPLPSLLPLVPFAYVPEKQMVAFWTAFLCLLLLFAIWQTKRGWADIVMVLAFYPVFQAAHVKTSSLLWFAVLLLTLYNIRKGPPILMGALLAYLPLKPQLGALFWVYAVVEAYRHNRRSLAWMLAWSAGLWATSLLLFPHWFGEWLQAISQYRLEAQTMHSIAYLPIGLLGIDILPAAAVLPFITLALFPFNDLYCAMVLIPFWRSFTPYAALAGCLFSLTGPWLFGDPDYSNAILFSTLLPCAAAILLARNRDMRKKILYQSTACV